MGESLTDIERWIYEYFTAQSKVEVPNAPELLDQNYFDYELLDSFGIVQLVAGIEEEFGIRLERSHFQDQRFCTIRGLAQIVDEERAG